jgi:hypothetical protein
MGRPRDPSNHSKQQFTLHLSPAHRSGTGSPVFGRWSASATVRLRLDADFTVYTPSRDRGICIRTVTHTSGHYLEPLDSSGDARWIINCHRFSRSRRCWIQIRNGGEPVKRGVPGSARLSKLVFPWKASGQDSTRLMVACVVRVCTANQHGMWRTY